MDNEGTTLISLINSKLENKMKNTLKFPILSTKVEEAIMESKLRSSPGPDGLTYEFYKFYIKEKSSI
ncbi:hypothetical protein BB558_007169 [Smittium angustum]|uniref:Reverse transcriptase domain-containing protein n=1 Tax=Smittium angustum TaxID=133377 RepID=A0A2U1IVS8_SMIAN|nr:hypothetical protein BB558_007169 [Smittium angustum]